MRVRGVGTDIIEIDRIKKVAWKRGRKFVERVFTKGELNFCMERDDPFPCLAARFAAKEAVFKALGSGLGGLGWKDVEVVRRGKCPPEILMHGRARELAGRAGIDRVLISVSHDKGRAIAFAIALGECCRNCSDG